MNLLRTVLVLPMAVIALLAMTCDSDAVIRSDINSLTERMKNLEQTFTTPPSVSLDQRALQIASIAAAQGQSTDPELIMEAFLAAGELVTYYLHAETSYTWSGTEWDLDYRSTNSFTSGNLTESISENWIDDHWENDSRSIQTYDGSNRLLTTTSQTWDTDHWQNGSLFLFTYNGSGLATEFVLQFWQSNAWVNYSKSISTYSGTKMTTQTYQMWNASVWVNQSRNTFTYNGSDQVTEILNEGWGDPIWYNIQRTLSTYTAGNLTLTLTQTYDVDGWHDIRKNEYTYDGSNREIIDASFNWSTITSWTLTHSDTSRYSGIRLIENVYVIYQSGAPIFDFRNLYTYDGAGNLTQDVNQSDNFGTWMNAARTTYYYTTSGIFDEEAVVLPTGFGIGQNYPNPFNSSTVIPYGLANDGHVRITVANILGQSVVELVDEFQSTGAYTAIWDGRDANGVGVASGIYFFRIQVAKNSQVRKMVLLK